MPLFKNLSAYDERSARLAGIALMVLSIFMFSFGDAMGKFLVGTYSVGQLLFLRACAALLLLSPMMWRQRRDFLRLERPWLQLVRVGLSAFHWVPPTAGSLVIFALAGCVSVTALFCVNRSLKLAPASVVVPYQYSMIVWAVIFGFVVFGDVPEVATIVGAAIIIGAGFYIYLRERDLGRGDAHMNPPV